MLEKHVTTIVHYKKNIFYFKKTDDYREGN